MRMTLIATAAVFACAGAALAAGTSGQTAQADDGRFIYDSRNGPASDPRDVILNVPVDRFGNGTIPQGSNPGMDVRPLQDRYIGPEDLRRRTSLNPNWGRMQLAQAESDTANDASAPVITLNGVRVAAVDTVALAEFYKTAFGMVEVNRIPIGEHPEIMVNFGTTTEQGIANPNGDVVIYPRESDDVIDPITHVIFNVSDAAAVVADVVAAGGTIVSEPSEFGDTGIVIAMVNDPVGNQIELIEGLE